MQWETFLIITQQEKLIDNIKHGHSGVTEQFTAEIKAWTLSFYHPYRLEAVRLLEDQGAVDVGLNQPDHVFQCPHLDLLNPCTESKITWTHFIKQNCKSKKW